jgi:hypothetical protein
MKRSLLLLLMAVVTGLVAVPALPRNGLGLTGVVQTVDLVSKTVGVKAGKQVIVFDARNARLKGYGSLGDVSRGDTVTVAYRPQGVSISKIHGCSRTPAPSAKAGRGQMRRLTTGERGRSFEDADENNDGKISAVELSVVVPGLTLNRFRQYDKDGDGYLSRKEFDEVWSGPH